MLKVLDHTVSPCAVLHMEYVNERTDSLDVIESMLLFCNLGSLSEKLSPQL